MGEHLEFPDVASDRVPGDKETTAWKRAARRHQSAWRKHNGWAQGDSPTELTKADGKAGRNFLSPKIHDVVLRRFEKGGGRRLSRNLLSSMPMCFNLFGTLAADQTLAQQVVAAWFPDIWIEDASVEASCGVTQHGVDLAGLGCQIRPRHHLTAIVAGNIVEHDGWVATVPYSSAYPLAVEIAPVERLADLASADAAQRRAFGEILQDVLRRIEALHDGPTPTMMWFNQVPSVRGARSRDIEGLADAWLNVEIVSPWRAPQVMRYIAAAEVATSEYFIPVVPEDLASRLAQVSSR